MTSKIVRADGTTVLANVKSCTFSETVNAEANLRWGCVSASKIDVVCYGSKTNAPASGEALTYYQVIDGVEKKIGVFYAEPVIPSRMTYSFTAYDAMARLDKDFSARLAALESSFPMTIGALVAEAATVAGVTLASNSWADSTMSVEYFYADGITCRQIFSWAAEIAGCFVQCDTTGKAVFRGYTARSGYMITPGSSTASGVTNIAYKQNGLSYANYSFAAVAAVAVHPTDEESIAYVYPSGVTTGNIVHVYGNCLLMGAQDTDYIRVATRLYTQYQGLNNYRPFEAKLFPTENPFRAGDIVSITDAQGVSFSAIAFSLTTNQTEAILSCSGNESFEEQTERPAKKQLVDLSATLVKIKNLFVESLEALVARIDTLFANEITVTGSLHSDDYRAAAGQPYAASGMSLNFDTKEISAPYFAVDEYGSIHGNQVYFGDMYLSDAMYGADSYINLAPSSMVDAQGHTSTNYTQTAYGMAIPNTNYNVRPGKVTEFHGYGVGEDGTFIYTFAKNPTLRYLRFTAVCDEAVVESKALPHVKLYSTYGSDIIGTVGEFDLTEYGVYQVTPFDDILLTVKQYYYYPRLGTSAADGFRVEITLPVGTSVSVDVARGRYSSWHGYNNNSELNGAGTYLGTDGVSAPVVYSNGNEVFTIAGGTVNGDVRLKSDYEDAVIPSSEKVGNRFAFYDKSGTKRVGFLSMDFLTDGRQGILVRANRADKNNYLFLAINSNGNPVVSLSASNAWLSALGLGTSGVLPITVSQGGTGATTVDGVKANLGIADSSETLTLDANGGTKSFTLANSAHGLIITTGADTTMKDIIIYHVTGSGAVSYSRVFNASRVIVTTSQNELEVTNDAPAAILAVFRMTW